MLFHSNATFKLHFPTYPLLFANAARDRREGCFKLHPISQLLCFLAYGRKGGRGAEDGFPIWTNWREKRVRSGRLAGGKEESKRKGAGGSNLERGHEEDGGTWLKAELPLYLTTTGTSRTQQGVAAGAQGKASGAGMQLPEF